MTTDTFPFAFLILQALNFPFPPASDIGNLTTEHYSRFFPLFGELPCFCCVPLWGPVFIPPVWKWLSSLPGGLVFTDRVNLPWISFRTHHANTSLGPALLLKWQTLGQLPSLPPWYHLWHQLAHFPTNSPSLPCYPSDSLFQHLCFNLSRFPSLSETVLPLPSNHTCRFSHLGFQSTFL